MKKINFLWLVGIFMLLPISLVSCSDDDEEGVGNKSDLIGLWEPIHIEGYEIYDGEKETWNEDLNEVDRGGYYQLEFLDGGIFYSYSYENGWEKDVEDGKYRLNGKRLVLRDDPDEEEYEMTIVSLTKTTLVLEGKESYDDEEYYEKVTYKRIR